MSLSQLPSVNDLVPLKPHRAPTLHWINLPPGAPWPKLRESASPDSPTEPLEEFETAAWEAERRLWVLDLHFDFWCGLAPIIDALTATPLHFQVRILSGRKERKEICRGLQQRSRELERKIEFRTLERDVVHDRFALVDDDLWHFGSTVGGGHHLFSAASRGWYERGFELQQVFDNVWKRASR